MIKATRLASAGLMAGAASGHAQSVATRLPTATDQALVTALIAAEDSRDSTIGPTDARRRGLSSGNAYVRAFTVRGLGRIEQGSMIPIIAPALDDSGADVRSAAANAVAQAASTAPIGSSALSEARALLTKRLPAETDPSVRAALLEAIGRLSQSGLATQVQGTARIIAPWLSSASPLERRGAIRGMFFLSQKSEARAAGVIPREVTDRLVAMLTEKPVVAYSTAERANLAAILVGDVALSEVQMRAIFVQPDPNVREQVVAAMARAPDTDLVRSIAERAVRDPAAIVRFRSISVYARRLRTSDGCSPLIQLARDRDTTIALAAVDALSGCGSDPRAVGLLDSMARSFRDGETWHLPTHAFVALAAVDPRRANGMMPFFAQARSVFVRTYAATAARLTGDTVTLYRLAGDSQPNVRASAIAGLSELVNHVADRIYRAALASDDNQLLVAAGAALKGSPDPTATKTAVLDAWKRLVGSGRETRREGESALLERMTEFRVSVDSSAIRPLTRVPTPTFSDLAAIEQTEASIEMADGAVVKLRFHPFDAPTSATNLASRISAERSVSRRAAATPPTDRFSLTQSITPGLITTTR